jgi:competence protein ComEC
MGKIKWYGLIGVCILVIIVVGQLIPLYDGKLHIVFCDVGQGDAIFIRTPDRKEVIIDGGPNTLVLECLSDHLPFWDRDLSMVIITHPHYDHFRGIIDVLQRYEVAMIGRENLDHNSSAYTELIRRVNDEKAEKNILERGEVIHFASGVTLEILGPDEEFLLQESPSGMASNTNPPSLILHLRYGKFSALFPGDSDGEDIEKFVAARSAYTVVALPHHGSENGYTENVSDHISMSLAIASSGKGNRYGHPHSSVLDLLNHKNIPILRTDQSGSIHLTISDQGEMEIKTKK